MPGRRRHDVDAAFGQVGFVGEAHLALAAAEQGLEHFLEVRVDALEGFLEAAARFGVELLDGFLGVADRIEQVLALRVQELVALLRFVKFFERLRIHRTQRFDARADFLVALLGFFNVDGSAPSPRAPAPRRSRLRRALSSLRLVSSRYFSSDCFRTSSSSMCERCSCAAWAVDTQRLERFIEGGQRFAAAGFLGSEQFDAGGGFRGMLHAGAGRADRVRYCRRAGGRVPLPCAPDPATVAARRAVI